MDYKTVKNYLYTLSYQALSVLMPLITAPYIARVLHADGVGVYSYTTTIAAAFALFAALGVNIYGQREIAYCQDDIVRRSKVFRELFLLRILTTAAVSTVYLVFCFAYRQYTHMLLLQGFALLAVMPDISWFYQGIEDFKLIAVRNTCIRLISVILMFTLVTKPEHLGRYILINSLAAFLSCLMFFPRLNKLVVRIPLKELNLKRHIRGNLEFFVPLIATQIYSQLDKIMLGAITANTFENGYYEQARKIINILIMVLTSVNTVMYPRIAGLYAGNEKEKIKQLYGQALSMITLLLVPIAIGLWFVADNFVGWFFGEGYAPVTGLLKWSIPLLVFMSLGNFVGMQYLSPTGRQNKMTAVYLQAAAVNLVLNAILIPRLQAVGAMIASLIAEAFSCFGQLLLLCRSQYRIEKLEGFWKYFASGFAMAAGLWVFAAYNPFTGALQTITEVSVGASIYACLLMITKERNMMRVLRKLKTAVQARHSA